ncbi:MAG: DUF6064 family protein [Hyphomicrobiales bacterium]
MLPFTPEVFFSLFAHYNGAIWPAQVIAYGLGVLVLGALFRPFPGGGRVVAAVLAGFWLWNGVVYHLDHFATINFTAYAFGLLFVLEALLIAWTGVLRGRLAFGFRPDAAGWTAVALIATAMVIYPLAAHLMGHGWPRAAMFGVAPCPTTIFTVGVLLLTRGRTPWHLMAIPVLWSLIGGTAPFLLGVFEDLSLLVAGLLGVVLAARRNRRFAVQETG